MSAQHIIFVLYYDCRKYIAHIIIIIANVAHIQMQSVSAVQNY